MTNVKSISLKPTLVGASVEFLNEEKMDCLVTQKGLPELISQLLYYREEGKELYPEIFILDDFELVKQMLPNVQFYKIGIGERTKGTMLKALKKCAPLTDNGWAIYILRNEESFEYGLFRAGTSILSVSLSETLIGEDMEECKIILIRQIAERLIEVKGNNAQNILVSYSNNDKIDSTPLKKQLLFIEKIVENVDDKLKGPTINFLKKLFQKVLKEGHGTLACVIDNKTIVIPEKLSDGIYLNERIKIQKVIKELRDKKDLQANSKLEGQLSLICGMMQSDGITIFTDAAEVVSYNVFVKHPEEIINTKTNGGARSRTYLTLSNMIGEELKSAYIQSQDGKIETKYE
ncbi:MULTISPECIES: hypothetical protein [unclassified Tenacibaculum]|uniref:hypothetical protein n=1 Tax=unclassified Tenacibaculum TaxID=2635139 RepID=UPI001F3BDB6B|nr:MULTISPECIES: hypothetical protein [unclassified Tenacibaculum]MCF2875932.1 hypothetical protein [Tenacibaculum sp. Cn5-1]MCF2936007.1 hypothetical protein [Tenacibaculum sp. Cn5-34]MCG7512568.1 hypothetical protein [Tenacibaculum sp. Cn5-46]